MLDVKDGKALLVSKYCLDAKPYNTEYESITWEICSLRAWLNNEFLNEAFDESELSEIVESKIQNPDNESWGTDGGNDTTDLVVLLSIDEAYEYFADDEARMAYSTEYAKAQGGWVSDTYGTSQWCLRSPGGDQRAILSIYSEGYFVNSSINYDGFAVRPALWVTLYN